jgi:hypothetical protein
MSSCKRWVPRLAAGVCCALVGAVWVPGVAGAAAGPKWAVVSSTGTLVRSHGATSAHRLAAGVYSVTFSSDMTGCAYEATSGDPGSASVAAPVAMVVGSGSSANDLHVKTFDQTVGAVADEPFHVTTYCGAKANFAVIASDGTPVRGSHVIASVHPNTGNYDVTFDHNVSKCAFSATSASTGAAGEISVAGLFGNKKGVFVQTLSRAGARVDVPFHLAVDCGAKRDIGVIDVGGSTARGTHVTSSASLQPGAYEVIFDRDVSGCAYTATIGEPTNSGEVDDPIVISTASRSGNVDGVFVDVQDVGGTPQDEPFHLNVNC